MLLALVLFIHIPTKSWSQIVAWQFGSANGNENTYTATTNNSNLLTSVLTRGTGVNVNSGMAYGFTANSWNSSSPTFAESVSLNEYLEFKIQPKAGYSTSLLTLDAKLRRTTTGPEYYIWKYSIDGINFYVIGDSNNPATVPDVDAGTVQTQVNLSSITQLQNVINETPVTFRIYAWGASGSSGSFGFAKTPVSTTTNCLAIGGTVDALTLSSSASTINLLKTLNSTSSATITSNTTWSAVSDQSWLSVSGATKGNGTLIFTTTETNPTIYARTANVTLSAANLTNRTITVTQAAGDATLSVSGTTAAVTKASGSTASLTVTSNSTWTATSDQTWLTVTSGATGNGTITFTTSSANPYITTRVATVTIIATGVANKTVTVTQAVGDATLNVSGTTAAVTKASGSTTSLTVTSNSTWTATSDQTWLNVTSGATGDGTITFTTASANPYITTRVATVTLKAAGVTDKTVTVTQAAGDATLSVSALTANVAKTANSTTTVDVTSNTTWTATSDQNWLAVTSGATGNATLTITSMAANPTITTRSAIVTLKATGATDKTVTITQAAGDPSLSVSATTANISKTINSIATIIVTSNTSWTATSDQSWLTVNSGATGSGNLTCTVSTTNPTIVTRTATVTIRATGVADKTVTVTQEAGDPTLSVSATTANVAKTANSTATVDVTSNTTWTAASNQSWLMVSSGATGNATITFTSAANPTIATRTAIVTLKAAGAADKTVTITQAVGDATLYVSALTANIPKDINSSATFDVTSNTTWTATSDQTWLTVNSGATGNATLTCTASSTNPTIQTRTATVTIKATGTADKTVTITQAIGDPTLNVSAITVNIAKTINSTATVSVTSNTTWTATSDQSWLTVNSGVTGNGTLTCTISSTNPTILTRTAIVTLKAAGVTDKTVTVTQAAGDATLSVSTPNVTIGKTANIFGNVNVTSNTTWTTSSNQSWLQVASGNVGNSILNFVTVTDNPMAVTRQAQITLKATGVNDVVFNVTQDAADPTLSVSTTTVGVAKTINSTANLTVNSNSTWIASCDKSWLTITQGATGNATLAITVTETNPTIRTRTATITIKASGLSDKIITVTQAIGDANLLVSGNTASVSKQANSNTTVSIVSNTTWTATSNQSWLSVISGATGNATLALQTSANPLSVTRIAIITLKAPGVTDKTITVTQDAGDPTLSFGVNSVTISKSEGSLGYVNVISNTNWSAYSDQNWLQVTSGSFGNGTITLTATLNPTISTRTAIVTVKVAGLTDKTFSVIQEAGVPVLSVSENSVVINSATNNSTTVKISTNSTWTATTSQSWLILNTDLDGSLSISAPETSVARIGKVTITVPGIADTKITVIQSAASASNVYQLNMTITSIVTVDTVEIANTNMQVSAYIGNECRGTTSLKYIDAYKRNIAYLMIWGNAADVNKAITFKCVNSTDSSSYSSTNLPLKFIPDLITGSSANPYSINVQQDSVNIAGVTPVNVSSLTGLTTGSVIAVNAESVLNIDKNISLKNISVKPGGRLTLKNGLTLNTKSLVLQSDPTGTTETATFVDNNLVASPSVTATVQQYLTSGRNWYISSPVSASTSKVFTASSEHPLYWYDEAHGSTAQWAQITNTSTPLVPLKGYIANLATSGYVSFTGTLNTGTQSITVYRTAGQKKEGFNLVGNPYPSYLDWDLATKTNLINTIWYRTKNTNTYVFDTYNSTGGIGTNNTGKGIVTKHIPPMQAFWVRVEAGKTSGTLTVDNTMRSHSQGGNPFKSPAQLNSSQSVVRMQISNGVNSDEAIVYFNNNASDGYDNYDSPKMSNESKSIPEIYTLAGNEQMCINGLNSIKYNEELPLGFNTEKANTFTLQATEISNFDADTKIILKDNLLNTMQELTVGTAYNFSSDITNTTNRFSLIFKSTGITTNLNQGLVKPAITAFEDINGHIVVSFEGIIAGQGDIKVYNSFGQIVENAVLQSPITVLNKILPTGVYFIKINYKSFDYCQKIHL